MPRVICAMFVSSFPNLVLAQDEEGLRPQPGPLSRLWRDTRASGVWRVDHFQSSKSFDDASGFTGTVFQFKAFPEITETLDGKLEVRGTNSAMGKGGRTGIHVLEAYATLHFARADLRLGKQIVPWGRADGINPTDNLTPRDYTVMLPFEDDQRFGTVAAKLDMFLSQEHTFTLFATPFFEPSRVPLASLNAAAEEETPARTLSNTEVGVRLNKVGEGLDWSLSYYRGFSLLPTLQLRYDRISVVGADFARNYGRFGVRGEVAYSDTDLYWIVGVDRTFLTNLNVNLQFFQRRLRDGAPDDVMDGVTFRLSVKRFNDTLEAEVFGAGHLHDADAFLRPLVTYAFTDHWKGTIGAELYFGGDETQYGSLKSNRGAFVELRYTF